MPEKVRVTINSSAAASILKSAGVLADLRARADRIAAAAGDGMEANSRIGRSRARASVVTATRKAMRAEATDRALTRSLDRGRG